LYKAGTRTAFVGFLLFWFLILFKFYKKYFILILLTFISVVAFNTDKVSDIIWQTKDIQNQSIDGATSGRLSIWRHDINLYFDFPIERKFLGAGLGRENKPVLNKEKFIMSAHNDYLTLLMTLGIFGLSGYIFIYFIIIKDIFYFKFNFKLRSYYIYVMLSVFTMNGISNSYITRVEMAQSLFFLIGIFYSFKWKVQNKVFFTQT
jgi:O-antigen ligase